MATSAVYASALGRLQVQFPSFIPKEAFIPLVNSKDVADITKYLETTAYGPEIIQAAASYRDAPLLEVAINRTIVKRNRQALEAAPFAGKAIVGAYLRRWDIQNIALILSAKAQGREVAETEQFLVSSRDIPAGLFAGSMTIDDFRILLQQPTVDAVAQSLVKFGYGNALLPLLDEFARSHDIFPLLHALDRAYYQMVNESLVYFQGDEWVVRGFVRSEIDVRNALLMLKGKDVGLPAEAVGERFLDGGEMPKTVLDDLYTARNVPDLATALSSRYPALPEGTPFYLEGRSLTGYESVLLRERAIQQLKRLRSYPLSISVIFTYLLLAELERVDLRRIIYGILYHLPTATLEALLIVPKL
jgi:V/A-type H+-transporting ATPase subunit C